MSEELTARSTASSPALRAQEALPTAVWSGTFRILGVDMKCHTLSDGQRIIEAESLDAFLNALRDTSVPDDPANHADLEALVRWQKGLNQPRSLSASEPLGEGKAQDSKEVK